IQLVTLNYLVGLFWTLVYSIPDEPLPAGWKPGVIDYLDVIGGCGFSYIELTLRNKNMAFEIDPLLLESFPINVKLFIPQAFHQDLQTQHL
ncbi:MAG: hypothetical protein U9N53_15650, partial [Bacteroidota bacterium]|nr:hypothetical protein [Bacteroidota bacterium]